MAKRRIALQAITFLAVLLIGLALGSFLEESRMAERVEEICEENENLKMWLKGNITMYKSQIESLNNEIKALNNRIEQLNEQLEIEILGIYFSPRGGCARAIINLVNSANKSIHVLIYSFTLDSIGYALIDAYRRGVDVRVVFEKNEVKEYSVYWMLKEAGVPVRNDTNPNLMHNKVMIIDSEIVVTGSYNWSVSAEERNDENIIIIRSRKIAGEYERKFEETWMKSAG